eukprot:TRINITY_DN4509_c0_g1_i1.p1 TRINITY_DN4509_c0_g1~~TRINITY_DN4509_c0_g1_i1.p1  ORF type:complete len:538 (+),score=177.24 TRINITY_DN4509_c0_g1_i1:126-1739(+)
MLASRGRKLGVGIASSVVGLFAWDYQFNAETIRRNLRTVYNGIHIALDYKLNFTEKTAASYDELHERVAQRLLRVCRKNGGLYIKMGQAIATNSAVLPEPYQRAFSTLYDSAPSVPYDQVVKIFREDFGKHPNEIFQEFSVEPLASASIAQVHKAKLKDGTIVAVKVQKPAIRKQMNSDLLAYKGLVLTYQYLFDLPLYWSCEYVISHIRQEVDFMNEAKNGEEAERNVKAESTLRNRVHIPFIFKEYNSQRVLVAEWIDGVKLTDAKNIAKMGFSEKEVMNTTIDLFASQIFGSGFVHSDPHPGNILVRPHPKNAKKHQVVLLDHGLYMRESNEFRLQYCSLWKSIFLLDQKEIEKICSKWGLRDPEILASMTLQRPVSLNRGRKKVRKNSYQAQMEFKERIKKFLSDQDSIPRELIFLSRNMELVRGNNKFMGSPVNRVGIMARWAVKNSSIKKDSSHLINYIKSTIGTLRFETSLFLISVAFEIQKFMDNCKILIFGGERRGFEDLIEDQVKEHIKQSFGVDVDSKRITGMWKA